MPVAWKLNLYTLEHIAKHNTCTGGIEKILSYNNKIRICLSEKCIWSTRSYVKSVTYGKSHKKLDHCVGRGPTPINSIQ